MQFCLARVRTFLRAFGHTLRAEGAGIEKSFKAIVNFEERIDHTGRIGNRGHVLLASIRLKGYPSGPGVKQVPFHRIHVGLPIRKMIVRRRRNDLR